MEYVNIQDKYEMYGCDNFILSSHEDLQKIHDVNINNIMGFEKFKNTKWDNTLKSFLLNFFNGWGLDARSTIKPISFALDHNDEGDSFIKFNSCTNKFSKIIKSIKFISTAIFLVDAPMRTSEFTLAVKVVGIYQKITASTLVVVGDLKSLVISLFTMFYKLQTMQISVQFKIQVIYVVICTLICYYSTHFTLILLVFFITNQSIYYIFFNKFISFL